MVEVEMSEWNDIFLYVVNYFKKETNQFKIPAASIQAHLKEIEQFISETMGLPDIVKKLKTLSPIWVENILIVEDEVMISDLIKGVLNKDGNIDVAYNRANALNFIENKYYKLVITDIDMAAMNGLSFYKTVTSKYPALKNRFLFLTGEQDMDQRIFFNQNKVNYLAKPMKLKTLKEVSSKIILSKSKETFE